MSGALKLSSEIALDQPDQADARIFARQMCTLLIHLCEERALAIIRGAPDHCGLEAWRLLHECYQPKPRSRGFGVAELNSWMGFRSQGTVLTAYMGLGECDAGLQHFCKSATTGRGAGGRVDFSISEGGSDILACASAGRIGEVESCATVAP